MLTHTNNSNYNFRTLNYLGSKLRLLDFIKESISCITPPGVGVCDLFAGSGCVSYCLSPIFSVTACDIQHYSEVICNALLHSNHINDATVNQFVSRLREVDENPLSTAFSPLIELETAAINNRNLETLTDIIEHGSLEVFRIEGTGSIISSTQAKVIDSLVSLGLDGKDSLLSRYYGGVYFSYSQAVQIDAIMGAIRHYPNTTDKNVLLAALLSTVSDIACTVGKHFAQPVKARNAKGNIKPLVYNKAVKDKTIDVLDLYEEWLHKYVTLQRSEHRHTVIQGDFLDCLNRLPANVHTVYADPPYTRDHYSRFYHVLETIALDDAPELSMVTIHGDSHVSNGIYRKDRHQSPFCIRSKAPLAFNDLFRTISDLGRQLLLSYSPYDETKDTHPRVVTINQLITWAGKYFNNVEIISAGHFTHNKLNSTDHLLESSDEAEMLIVCRNMEL